MTTYYVDATGGNDGDPGTSPGTAWQTIGKVNGETFNPGDSILFKRGETWSGTVLQPPSSGASGSPITFGAYDSGALPIITANDAIARAVYVLGLQYVDLEYLDVRSGNDYGIDIQSNYVEMRNCVVEGCGDDNITVGPNAHDVLIEDTVSYDPYRRVAGPTISCIEIQDGAYNVTVRNCECYGSEEVGIHVHGHLGETMPYNIYVCNCYTHNNTGNGIRITNAGNVVTPLVEVDHCYVIDNGDIGIYLYNTPPATDPQNVTVKHCYVEGSVSYQATISGDGHTYYRNVFSGTNGVHITDATNLDFLHNTIYNTAVGTPFAFTGTNNAGTEVKNCVLYTSVPANNMILVQAGAHGGLDIDYNLYYHISGIWANRWYWNGVWYHWAGWLANSGQDANSPTPADPLFTDASNERFHLQHGSPALQVGVSLTGYPFYGTAPDCGRWEMRWLGAQQLLAPQWRYA